MFNHSRLIAKIIVRCILELMKNKDEDRLEGLCEMLVTVGEELELTVDVSHIFAKVQEMIDDEVDKISSRIRFVFICNPLFCHHFCL